MTNSLYRSFRRASLAVLLTGFSLGLTAGCDSNTGTPGSIKIEGDKSAVLEPKFNNPPSTAPEKKTNQPQPKSIKDRAQSAQ